MEMYSNLYSELYFLESANTKNIMYLSVGYMHMLQCIIKPRLDLKSTHSDNCFGIKNFFLPVTNTSGDKLTLHLRFECV